ncbi:MAG TPA: T9SS type A sorting domain-containing protein [Bacteroidetes bacterium]|nr:T9SS type A sorting domain-containing protein [Bacteroidota bacterium]
MKKIYTTGFFRDGLLTGLILLGFALTAQAQVVVIDPGHGYNCSGSNVDGRTTTEIYTALATGQKLQNLIAANNCGWTVHLTRTTNGNCGWTSVTQRATQSNSWNATRFISIHCNAGGGTGTETFYCNLSSSLTSKDIAFAQKVQDNMVTEGSWANRRMVEDRSYLNYHLGVLRTNNAPACLNEIGFVDRTSDAAKLNSNTWRDKFALAYFKALQSELGTCTGGGGSNGNLAPAGSIWSYTTQLSASYSPAKAIDGTVGTRWNSNGAAATNYFIVRLDGRYNINKFKVKHASNAGLSVNLNTERYYVLYWNGSGWSNAVTNYHNASKAPITSHNVNVTAEWVCLYITDPTFTSDLYSRIPEFEVYGTAAARLGTPPTGEPDFPAFSDVSLLGAAIQATPSIVQNGQTAFAVKVAEATEAVIEIIDLTGQVVETLPSRIYGAGSSSVQADLSELAAGVYLYRLVNWKGVSATGKLIIR